MVLPSQVHIIGSWYMAFNGGFKPCTDAFVKYFKTHKLNPKRVFFLGDRLVDMELADSLAKKLGFKYKKCLILRDGDKGIGVDNCDYYVHNLKDAYKRLKKFNPDLVFSDFDNTLVHSFYDQFSDDVERVRFWERYCKNLIIRIIYGLISQFDYFFMKRELFETEDDNTEAFLKVIEVPIVIHSMSSELIIKKTLKEIIYD